MAIAPKSFTETLTRRRPQEIVASRSGRLRLRVVTAGDGRDLEVEGPRVTIGSHQASTVTVDDLSVSRAHCELEVKETGVMLRDSGSKNGTWFNGIQVSEIWLPVGSHFTIGNSTVTLRGVGAVEVHVSNKGRFGGLHGSGTTMGELFAKLERIASVELDVLCVGETGTGKELIAKGIHEHSDRRHGPFVVVDCTTLNSGIAESILFGHRKGSFTDASRDQAGLLEQADGGTLFLDEIGELPVDLQPKLLRCLETSETRRLGDYRYRRFDARLVAATNRNLLRMISKGEFREDLYYRLAATRVDIPPLRDRSNGNISLLADLFLERLSRERGMNLCFDKEVYAVLERHRWRGNVRELYNTVRTVAMLSESETVHVGDLPSLEAREGDATRSADGIKVAMSAVETLFGMSWERARRTFGTLYATRLMTDNGGNQTRAAQQAEISRNTFRSLLRPLDDA
ncbi:MAG: sigma 54-interacting transcriptional regulator [Myxococcota bacterium]